MVHVAAAMPPLEIWWRFRSLTASHESLPRSAGSWDLGDLARWRSIGCALATGGEVDGGEAGSAASEDSNPSRALRRD